MYNKKPWLIIIIVIALSVFGISMVQYSYSIGYKMTLKHSVLVNATIDSRLNLATSHLWLEEMIGGDDSIKKSQISELFYMSKWYLKAMMEGGQYKDDIYLPLDSKQDKIITEILKSIELIDKLETIAYSRLNNVKLHKIGSNSDTLYDALFNVIINKIQNIENNLQKLLEREINDYTRVRNILFALIIFTNIIILLSYKFILDVEKDWILKYFKIDNENVNLAKLNKELEQAQELIDYYIPISQTDINGLITKVNSAMCKLTGYKENELIGKNHRILKFPDEKIEKYNQLWNVISNAQKWEGELKNMTKSGDIYWVYAHIHPIVNHNDKILGYQALRENITNQKKLEYLSSHDNLTSIYNRDKFDSLVKYELKQFLRNKNVFSLAIFDLDFFKKVNDTYGHQVGDSVLVESVLILKESIRDSDVLARWGGEEFVLLLPHTNNKQAKIVCEKIRKSIEENNFTTVDKITISCGLSEVIEGDTESSLLKRIDDALYQAKDNGRNQVSIL